MGCPLLLPLRSVLRRSESIINHGVSSLRSLLPIFLNIEPGGQWDAITCPVSRVKGCRGTVLVRFDR